MTNLLSNLAVISLLVAALFYAVWRLGRWQQRALTAEKSNKENHETQRKINAIQSDIVFDPAERERVRRKYDTP